MGSSAQLQRLQKRLEAIPKAARAAVQPTLLKNAETLADAMRLLAESSRDTGNLIDSIAVTPGGGSTPPYSQPGGSMAVPENAVAITVGNSKVRYPHLVEYGTAKAHAQPFFWPAFRIYRKRIARSVARAIGKAIREAQ